MTTIEEINKATSIRELEELTQKAATERNCELDSSASYAEGAWFFGEEAPKSGGSEEKMEELAGILYAAEAKHVELSNPCPPAIV